MIFQVAFGWTDSHLHQFGSGSRYHGPETEYYLCPYQVNTTDFRCYVLAGALMT